nr:CoA pyrophosphatase [Dietzia maris]
DGAVAGGTAPGGELAGDGEQPADGEESLDLPADNPRRGYR